MPRDRLFADACVVISWCPVHRLDYTKREGYFVRESLRADYLSVGFKFFCGLRIRHVVNGGEKKRHIDRIGGLTPQIVVRRQFVSMER